MNKKFLVLGAFCAMISMSVTAQQLPNVGFENWEKPGKSTDLSLHPDSLNFNRPGQEPTGWNGSSVDQLYTPELIRDTVAAHTGSHSAVIHNEYVGIKSLKMGSVAPGYFTLGTPWIAADMQSVPNSNGGTYGGEEFTSYPDAIVGYFKRVDSIPAAQSTIVAYLWNGEFDSKIGKVNDMSYPIKNTDRAVMGKEGAGAVTGNGKLVASLEKRISWEEVRDWTMIEVPFTYIKGAGEPTMHNVIVSAGDYWDRAALEQQENVKLMVDDLRYVYYSTLESLTIKGVPVPNFKSDVYSYDMTGDLPTEKDIEYVANGISCDEYVTIDLYNSTVTIKLTGEGEDIDGQKSHTYVLNYPKAGGDTHAGAEYKGDITIDFLANIIPVPDQSVFIEKSADGKSCTFALYEFSLDGNPANSMGDIIIENVSITEAGDSIAFAGAKQGIELAGGTIKADAKLKGAECKADGVLVMNIQVEWDNYGTRVPIKVVFNGKAVQGGVESVETSNAVAYGLDGAIAVDGFNGLAKVYALDGRLVKSVMVEDKAQVNITKGIYVIVLSDKAVKVIVK